MQEVIENTDNYLKKNNIKRRGLKEGLEGGDLATFMVHLFLDEWALNAN